MLDINKLKPGDRLKVIDVDTIFPADNGTNWAKRIHSLDKKGYDLDLGEIVTYSTFNGNGRQIFLANKNYWHPIERFELYKDETEIAFNKLKESYDTATKEVQQKFLEYIDS